MLNIQRMMVIRYNVYNYAGLQNLLFKEAEHLICLANPMSEVGVCMADHSSLMCEHVAKSSIYFTTIAVQVI